MIIRMMQEEDIPELSALYEQFWGEKSDIENMKKQFRTLLQKNTHILLSAVEDGKLTGSVMGVVCEELYGECKPFLVVENMVVDKDCRRKGLGKALLSELEKLAKQRGCTQMILVTETNRADACGFYQSAGFDPDINKGYKKKL